jgi:hypothetical protein
MIDTRLMRRRSDGATLAMRFDGAGRPASAILLDGATGDHPPASVVGWATADFEPAFTPFTLEDLRRMGRVSAPHDRN